MKVLTFGPMTLVGLEVEMERRLQNEGSSYRVAGVSHAPAGIHIGEGPQYTAVVVLEGVPVMEHMEHE